MTKRQLVKWLEAKQSDAKAEVEIQYATAEQHILHRETKL